MEIKPFRAYNDDSLAADFPAAKIIFHHDDFTSGATTWVARKGDITANLAAAAVKDAAGVYTTVTNSVSSITGTMPTLADKYVVAVAIGNLQTNSASVGVSGTFGSATTGPGLTVTGIATDNNPASLNSPPTLTGSITALNADPGREACQVAYWDMVDTSSPLIARALASSLSTDQAIPNGTATTTSTGQVVLGAALDSAMLFTALAANNDGRRVKVLALFEFSTSLTLAEIQVACAEMARTGELYAGWRNRT